MHVGKAGLTLELVEDLEVVDQLVDDAAAVAAGKYAARLPPMGTHPLHVHRVAQLARELDLSWHAMD